MLIAISNVEGGFAALMVVIFLLALLGESLYMKTTTKLRDAERRIADLEELGELACKICLGEVSPEEKQDQLQKLKGHLFYRRP